MTVFWNNFSPIINLNLYKIIEKVNYHSGDYIFKENERDDQSCYFLISGKISVVRIKEYTSSNEDQEIQYFDT